MDEPVNKGSYNLYSATQYARRIHACIIVVPISAVYDSTYLSQMASTILQMKVRAGLPTILVSLVDTIDPSVRKTKQFNSPILKQMKTHLASALQLPEQEILFGLNYVHEPQRDCAIDLHTFALLHHIIEKAKAFHSQDTKLCMLQ